ncbi:MAG: hypothetical protein JO001_06220 [Alphaproteobacteria bacterium]|nr:hypothetical protein [Alphaproteobacteria bacterium]
MWLTAKRVLITAAGIMLVITMFLLNNLENGFLLRSQARQSNVEEGRTIPFAEKNAVVYITQQQNDFDYWLRLSSPIEIGVIALVLIAHGGNPYKSR